MQGGGGGEGPYSPSLRGRQPLTVRPLSTSTSTLLPSIFLPSACLYAAVTDWGVQKGGGGGRAAVRYGAHTQARPPPTGHTQLPPPAPWLPRAGRGAAPPCRGVACPEVPAPSMLPRLQQLGPHQSTGRPDPTEAGDPQATAAGLNGAAPRPPPRAARKGTLPTSQIPAFARCHACRVRPGQPRGG